jgi:hypothetical protein
VVGTFILNAASNTSLVRRDGAEVAAGRGLQLARRVVGVYRIPIFDFIKPLVANNYVS